MRIEIEKAIEILGQCAQNDDRERARLALSSLPSGWWTRSRPVGDLVEQAAQLQLFDVLRLVVDLGYPIDSKTSTGATPLKMAVHRRDIDAIKVLLELGAEPSLGNRGPVRNPSSLRVAASNGDTEIVELLLDHGGDIDEITSQSIGVLIRIPGDTLRAVEARGGVFHPEIQELLRNHVALGDRSV